MSFEFKNLIEIKDGLSQKKIYRKREEKISKIVIDFSANKTDFENFLNVFNILKNINISVPKIYEVHTKQALIIMEDFGNNSFEKFSNKQDLYNLLKLAVDNLIIIQNSLVKDDLVNLTKYGYKELKNELSEFVNYYIPYKKISNFPLNNFYDLWLRIYETNSFVFDSFVHKDYEFINLILLNDNKLHLKCGIIDFQSAFIGFKGWDLFSILENPRINFTREYNKKLIKYFYENVDIKINFTLFQNQYYLLNLARQTRLLGRWAKLIHMGKNEYLKYIPTTKERITSSLPNIKDTELKIFYDRFL